MFINSKKTLVYLIWICEQKRITLYRSKNLLISHNSTSNIVCEISDCLMLYMIIFENSHNIFSDV